MDIEKESFLKRNNINSETWEKSNCDWSLLYEIYADHCSQKNHLSESAALYANVIQTIPKVHSVRWRVKDPEHLLEKIVRKKAAGEAKYSDINAENYYDLNSRNKCNTHPVIRLVRRLVI